jgi:hypothetical protein
VDDIPSGLISFEQISAWPPLIMSVNQPPALEEVMENFAELIQRLLEIQSGGRPRSLELIAEDERLMDALQKRNLGGKPTQTVQASEDGSERVPIQGLTFFAADSGSTDEVGCEP